jgi:long-chain acyl-CoA synthetase
MEEGRHYPGGVPISINYPEVPLYAFLENAARKFPNRDAVIFYGNRIGYPQLWVEAKRLAGSLKDMGVDKGDRVGLLLPNVPQFIIAYYGTMVAGGVVVAVNPLNPVDEIKRELSETGADVLIFLDRFIDRLPETRVGKAIVTEAGAYLPQGLKLLSHLRSGRLRRLEGALNFRDLVRRSPQIAGDKVDARRDLAVIQYTGGTTSLPKGVMLTHYNLVSNALQSFFWLRGWGYSAKPQLAGWPVTVCAVPFFHIYGMTVALNEAVQSGSTLVLIPDPQPEAIMKAIDKHKCTHFPAIPRMIQEIVGHSNRLKYDLTSLTSCVSGGAPIDPDLVKKFIELTGVQFYHGYGLTEAGPVTHCTPVDGGPSHRSVGLPFPDTEAKIMDLQTGEIELPPEEEGELVIRGPQVMQGYWQNLKKTTQALRDGWLYTGDAALVDNDGYLYIVDRKEERIVHAGHTVWPSEVEDLLVSHTAVELAALIGVPDPLRCATDLRAVVSLKQGFDGSELEKDLMELCRERLEPFQVPTKIVVTENLPRTPLGKVDRVALRARLDIATDV